MDQHAPTNAVEEAIASPAQFSTSFRDQFPLQKAVLVDQAKGERDDAKADRMEVAGMRDNSGEVAATIAFRREGDGSALLIYLGREEAIRLVNALTTAIEVADGHNSG